MLQNKRTNTKYILQRLQLFGQQSGWECQKSRNKYLQATVAIPPMIGSGIRVNTAPIFPRMAKITNRILVTCKTALLPTCTQEQRDNKCQSQKTSHLQTRFSAPFALTRNDKRQNSSCRFSQEHLSCEEHRGYIICFVATFLPVWRACFRAKVEPVSCVQLTM